MERPHASPSWAARFVLGCSEQIHMRHAAFQVDPVPWLTFGVQHEGRLSMVTDNGTIPLTTSGISGMQHQPRRFAYSDVVSHTLLRLRPEAAYAVLGIGAHALSGESPSIEDLFGRARSEELFERVCSASDQATRMQAMVQVLDALPIRNTVTPFVKEAMRLIEQSQGTLAIGALRDALGVNERRLERRFLEEVGLTPKRYARLVRFTHAAHLARTLASLTEASHVAGYSDPAHFAREARRYTGAPASALRDS